MSQNCIVLNPFMYAYLNFISDLERLHSEGIWEDCMRKKQCCVEFEYHISICSLNEENRRRSRSNWPALGPSSCTLTFVSSPVLKCAKLNDSTWVRNCLVSKMFTCGVSLGQSRWPCSLRVGPRPLDCWDWGFECRWAHGCPRVFVECCVASTLS